MRHIKHLCKKQKLEELALPAPLLHHRVIDRRLVVLVRQVLVLGAAVRLLKHHLAVKLLLVHLLREVQQGPGQWRFL